MRDNNNRLAEAVAIGHELLRIRDLDLLLERILTESRRLLCADAGSIYMREGDHLKFSYTQNDTHQKKLAPGKKLIYATFSVPISNRSISGYVANTGQLLNIPDAYDLIGATKTPYSFDPQYDQASGYRTRSMLTTPIRNYRGDVIGVLQLINAKDPNGNVLPFHPGDEPLITHFADNAAVAIERAQMTRAIIMRMISMAELRDPKETGPHVNRVAAYAVEIYEQWARMRNMSAAEIEQNRDVLRMAAMLHDVGKIAISDAILKKPARLDPDEIKVMQQHTFLGARLFNDHYSDFDEASMIVAMNHHEKWDGTGYPGHIDPVTTKPMVGYTLEDGRARGKHSEEIHPFGRVVAIADVYDALSCRRVYKEPWTEDQVLDTMRSDAGKHFDPGMIDSFFESLDTIRAISSRYPDTH